MTLSERFRRTAREIERLAAECPFRQDRDALLKVAAEWRGHEARARRLEGKPAGHLH